MGKREQEWVSANEGGGVMVAAAEMVGLPCSPFIYLFSFSLSETAAVS